MNHSESTIDISINWYNDYSTSKAAEKRGTLIYAANQYNSKTRKDLDSLVHKSKQSESTFIEIINPKKKNIVVRCIYRHPTINNHWWES